MIDPISEEIIKRILKTREDRIKELEDQISALKRWIKYNTDVEIEMDGLVEEMDGLFPQSEVTLTKKEIEQLEYHSKLLEQHSNMFNYGRETRGEKMAESL